MSTGIDRLARSGQIIISAATEAESFRSKIYLFERQKERWGIHQSWDAVIGKNGLACGSGILNQQALPPKKEGDHKAPAGVFNIGTAFGYQQSSPFKNIEYLPIHQHLLAIDDPGSSYYNHIINDLDKLKKDWNSAEQMYRRDELYKWGLVINHNFPQVIPGQGSCIFLHIWRDGENGTEGCTAMPEEKVYTLINWLNRARNPLFIQGTKQWLLEIFNSVPEILVCIQ